MNVNSFLDVLPEIAGSPFAVAAYILVCGGWLLWGVLRSRAKTFLQGLEKLPEQDRAKAARDHGWKWSDLSGLTREQRTKLVTRKYLLVGYLLTLLAFVCVAVSAIQAMRVETETTDKPPVGSAVKTKKSFGVIKDGEDLPGGEVEFEFTLTNPNDWEASISKILIEVVDAKLDEPDSMYTFHGAFKRAYTCKVAPRPALYQAEKASEDFEYIKLSKGEAETFQIHVAAEHPRPERGKNWFYTVRIRVEYNVGGRTETLQIGKEMVVVLFP